MRDFREYNFHNFNGYDEKKIMILKDYLVSRTINNLEEAYFLLEELNNNKEFYKNFLEAEIHYYKDYITLSRDLLNSYSYDAIYKLFDIDNYIMDGPDFNKSLDYLDSKESTCLKIYSDLKDMLNKDVILSYLDSNIDEYYKDFYNELMIDNNSDVLNDLESEEKEYETFMGSVKDVFNYLKTNKDKWEIYDYQIYFDGQVLADEYNQLLEKVANYESDFKQNI